MLLFFSFVALFFSLFHFVPFALKKKKNPFACLLVSTWLFNPDKSFYFFVQRYCSDVLKLTLETINLRCVVFAKNKIAQTTLLHCFPKKKKEKAFSFVDAPKKNVENFQKPVFLLFAFGNTSPAQFSIRR